MQKVEKIVSKMSSLTAIPKISFNVVCADIASKQAISPVSFCG
jgi:hypothetical protein